MGRAGKRSHGSLLHFDTIDIESPAVDLVPPGCCCPRPLRKGPFRQFDIGLVDLSSDWESYLTTRSSGFRKRLRKLHRGDSQLGELRLAVAMPRDVEDAKRRLAGVA